MREKGGLVLLAVADGVGGAAGGEIAADAAIAALDDRFFASGDAPVEQRLADAMRDANTAVLAAAGSSGNAQAASTLVSAVVRGPHVVLGNLGDSRAYLVRGGESRRLTEDHSGGTAHAITRFVGDPRGVQPDVFVEELRPADRLLLCSDGLTRHVEDTELAALAVGPLDAAADRLVTTALERGGADNVTVVLYEAAPPRPPTSVGSYIVGALIVVVVLFALVVLWATLAATSP